MATFSTFRRSSTRAAAVLSATALVGGLASVLPASQARASDNLGRFARVAGSAVTASRSRTPNGWALRPAGAQVELSRAPTGVAVSPDHRTVVAVNSATTEEELAVVDAQTLVKTAAPSTDLYLGAAIDADGNVWASGGSRNRVFQYKLAGPLAVGTRHVGAFPGTPNDGIPVSGYPGSMVLGDRGRLFVAGNLSVPAGVFGGSCASGRICSAVAVVDVSDPARRSPPVRYVPVGRDAYGVAFSPSAGKLYVSNWADETDPARAGGTGSVSVVDVSSVGAETEVQVVPVGRHPTGIALAPDGRTLAVANAADDTFSLLHLDDAGLVASSATHSVRTAAAPDRGSTPLAVAWAPDGAALYVVLAGVNAIEVRTADGSSIPRRVVVGHERNRLVVDVPETFIPTGWYPSAIASAPHPSRRDGRLYVTNLKGIGAGPGANAYATMGSRTQGTMSVVDIPADASRREEALDRWTAITVENNGWVPAFAPGARTAASDPCQPAPMPGHGTAFSGVLCDAASGRIDPRQLHVVYIVKENKTFDQFFGDIKPTLPGADADPAWLLYGEPVTTNQHELARRFSLSDRFWADSEQSTTGHSWTSSGYATEYNEITWNPEYDQGLRGARWSGQYDGQLTGPSDPEIAEQEGELLEPAERLVDLVAARPELSVRVYSDDVNADSPAKADQVPLGMWGIGSSAVHRGRDLDFPDTDRARLLLHGRTVSNAWSIDKGAPPPGFGKEIAFDPADRERFVLDAWSERYAACVAEGKPDAECQTAMPNLLYVALPDDHTLGFNPMSPTPASMVADNDYATGLIVEGLSRSPFWRNTLVLITEDDTQAAGDHVDAHRTFLIASGGLAKRHGPAGQASHQPGSFPSILKTIEVLFGLDPLTVYDRAAVPLHDLVADALPAPGDDVPGFEAVRPPTPFLRNPEGTDLARLSAMLDWRLDRTDPFVLRDLLYAGLRGKPLPDRYRTVLLAER